MSKHTAGPWTVGYESFCVDAGEMKICDIRGWGYLTGKGALGLPESEAVEIQAANARLIAAAPEMFEALRWMVEKQAAIIFASEPEHVAHFMARAYAALEKVEQVRSGSAS